MRRILVILGLAGALYAVRRNSGRIGLTCFWRQGHDPVRHPLGLGGWLCSICSVPIADLGYVNPTRKIFDRNHETVTRTSSYEAERQPTRRVQ